MPDTVFVWLKKYESYGLDLKNWRKRLAALTDKAGISKRMGSIFRKSFATHACPISGSGVVSVQMGHTGPSTTEKHYKGLVPLRDAKAYFAILPQ